MEWNQLLSKQHYYSDIVYNNDYDTIICSTLFRRLQDKAQVFPLDNDDYIRTRLTHSLEVSAIGKRLGEYVFKKLKKAKKDLCFETHTEKNFSDVLLCAGLVHDIGNPPFGHFGEYAIREWFQTNLNHLYLGKEKITNLLSDWQLQDLYSFEGNAQSLRILSKTPYLGKRNGFNLSYEILGAIMKYPISSEDLLHNNPKGYKKMGYNFSEKELFRDINRKMGLFGNRHPLSYLLEAADDIAYRTSDVEDAMVKKVIGFQDIVKALQNYEPEDRINDSIFKKYTNQLVAIYNEELKKNDRKPELTAIQRWNQFMQGIMIANAGDSFFENYAAIMSGDFCGNLFDGTIAGDIIRAIAELSERLIYTSSIKTRTELFGRRVINSLLDQFMPAALLYDTGESISFIEKRTIDTVSEFYKSMYHSEAYKRNSQEKLYLRILMITDYISGMTDSYAKRLYQELFA